MNGSTLTGALLTGITLIGIAPAPASAARFSPDRPGIGASTGTVPKGRAMVEAGAELGGVLGAGAQLGLPGLSGRVGLARRLELRIAAPGVLIGLPGVVSATPWGLGVKLAGPATAAVGWSLTPMARLPAPGSPDLAAALGADLGGTLSWGPGDWGAWGTGLVGGSAAAGLGGGAGGGLWYAPDTVGLYAHTGAQAAGGAARGFVGGGGWWVFAEDAQADIGVDVLPGEIAAAIVRVGVSVQR